MTRRGQLARDEGMTGRTGPQEAGEEGRGQSAEEEGAEAPRGQLAGRPRRKRPRRGLMRPGSWGDDEEEPPSATGADSSDGGAPASLELLPTPALVHLASSRNDTPALVHRQVNGGDCCWRALAAAIANAEEREGYRYHPNVEGPYRASPAWSEVKDRVIVHMLRYSSRYAAWFSGRMPTRAGEPGDWNAYLRKLAEPRSWGSDLEVAAAAREYGCPIVILSGMFEYQVFHKRGWRAPLVLYYQQGHFSWMSGRLSRAFLQQAEERPPRHWRGGARAHLKPKHKVMASPGSSFRTRASALPSLAGSPSSSFRTRASALPAPAASPWSSRS